MKTVISTIALVVLGIFGVQSAMAVPMPDFKYTINFKNDGQTPLYLTKVATLGGQSMQYINYDNAACAVLQPGDSCAVTSTPSSWGGEPSVTNFVLTYTAHVKEGYCADGIMYQDRQFSVVPQGPFNATNVYDLNVTHYDGQSTNIIAFSSGHCQGNA